MQCGVEDPTSMEERVDRFLSTKETEAVTGTRRMGRERFVEFVGRRARAMGMTVSMDGEPVDDADILLLLHWDRISDDVFDRFPDADILYGQDLCHQVPAVVRYEKPR